MVNTGESKTTATSKMEHFNYFWLELLLEVVNYYHKELHFGCCSSPRSTCGKHNNATFYNRTESGTIRDTSEEKLYQEVGFEIIKERRWFRRLCCFYTILKNWASDFCLILPPSQIGIISHVTIQIRQISCITVFSNSFLARTVRVKDKLDYSIVMRCAIWYHLYNFNNVKTPMEQRYFMQ